MCNKYMVDVSEPLRGSFNALILEINEKRIKTKSDYPRDLVNIQDQSTGPALSCTPHLPGYQLYLHSPEPITVNSFLGIDSSIFS